MCTFEILEKCIEKIVELAQKDSNRPGTEVEKGDNNEHDNLCHLRLIDITDALSNRELNEMTDFLRKGLETL